MEILSRNSILVFQTVETKEDATQLSGQLLVDNGYVEEAYISSMHEKLEKEGYATYIGNGVAIPHGMEDGKTVCKKYWNIYFANS